MSVDSGSRHAPDVQRAMSMGRDETSVDGGDGVTSTMPALSEEERQRLNWLRGLVGCSAMLPLTADIESHAQASCQSTSSSSTLPAYIRVSLHDGRVYEGRLQCIDRECNLCLSHAQQAPSIIMVDASTGSTIGETINDGTTTKTAASSSSPSSIRSVPVGGFSVGFVMCAWKMIRKVEVRRE